MADPVATVEKIVKIGLKIKEAVDTVRLNEDECREIRKRVLRFSAILTQLQQTGMMNDSPAMSGALEDLEETLQQALELVTACQERSTIHRLVRAGDLAKQLRRVKDDILNKVMLASFAIHATTIVLLTIQAGGHPLPQQPEDAGAVRSTDGARSELNDVENNVLAGMETSSVAIREFKWSELKAATNDFSDGNIIGEGGQFIVYKGILKDGNIVAVKINIGSWSDNWTAHINCDQLIHVFSNLEHKNIVQFVGYCYGVLSTAQLFKRKRRSAKERQIIWVEEYVPNGDLLEIIRESRHDWSSLFRIIDGVAQGVHYLHEHHVVHMDVKPSNILLDSDMNPIITDFNISVALDNNNDEMILDSVRGTMGYAAPEYISEGILSTKNDVYAYGITLLDAVGSISRCKCGLHEYRTTTNYHYDLWAWKAWEAGRIEEEFDSSLFDGSQLTEIKRCVQVGLLCTQADRADRPTMADVLEMLHGEKELPIPKIPLWYSRTSSIWDSIKKKFRFQPKWVNFG